MNKASRGTRGPRWSRVLITLPLLLAAIIIFRPITRVAFALFITEHPSLEEIEKLTLIRFPKGAKLLGANYYPGLQDRQLIAAVEINPEDIKRFTSDPDAKEGGFGTSSYDDSPWWKPCTAPKHVEFGILRKENGYPVRMVIDIYGKRRAVAYLVWIRQS